MIRPSSLRHLIRAGILAERAEYQALDELSKDEARI